MRFDEGIKIVGFFKIQFELFQAFNKAEKEDVVVYEVH